jgi:MSHA biogenesis protein MshE
MRDGAAREAADIDKTMESAAKRRLGDIIVKRGLITAEQLEEALAAQRESGAKLGEVLVDLGFITRVALAGVISEQWDDLRVTTSGRKNAETNARSAARAGSSVVETALRERLEALTVELAARDQRIAQQDATISALLAQLPSAAA